MHFPKVWYAVMLAVTALAHSQLSSTNHSHPDNWLTQGTNQAEGKPALDPKVQNYLKPVKKPRPTCMPEVLEKGPKFSLGQISKPRGFNDKKDKITLAKLPPTGLEPPQPPYQRYRYIQVSDNKDCSKRRAPCEITGNEIYSYRIRWTLDSKEGPYKDPKHTGTGHKSNNWNDGGFQVVREQWTPWPNILIEAAEDKKSKRVKIARNYVKKKRFDPVAFIPPDFYKQRDKLDRLPGVNHRTVLCGSPTNETICAWWRVAYTGYGVGEYWHKKDEAPERGDLINGTERVMLSPNKNLTGMGIVCAANEKCQKRADHKWGPLLKAGGPQPYPYEEDFQ